MLDKFKCHAYNYLFIYTHNYVHSHSKAGQQQRDTRSTGKKKCQCFCFSHFKLSSHCESTICLKKFFYVVTIDCQPNSIYSFSLWKRCCWFCCKRKHLKIFMFFSLGRTTQKDNAYQRPFVKYSCVIFFSVFKCCHLERIYCYRCIFYKQKC